MNISRREAISSLAAVGGALIAFPATLACKLKAAPKPEEQKRRVDIYRLKHIIHDSVTIETHLDKPFADIQKGDVIVVRSDDACNGAYWYANSTFNEKGVRGIEGFQIDVPNVPCWAAHIQWHRLERWAEEHAV